MASMIYDSDYSTFSWLRPGVVDLYSDSHLLVNPYPCPPDVYVNKVWDPIDGAYVRWRTYAPDLQGSEYPGTSVWAAVAASFCVEHITFQRLGA